jgi:DHA2 family multidrug resistance protein
MNVLDSAIANVAIPTIAGDLGVSPNQGTWVITSFAVSQAIMLPITGWLARRFGEIRLFILSTFLFIVTSVLCGLSLDLPMLVFFRVLQGAVSGPMIPLSQSILLANYPENKRGFATSIWAMVAVVGPIAGPILGGWITDNFTWPWIFYINLPIGTFSVVVTSILLSGKETPTSKTPIDVIGLVLLTIGIGALQILLDNGNDMDWFHSNVIAILAIISVISLSFLVIWELTEQHPIIDLTLFARRNFFIGVFAYSLGFLVYFSNVVIFPLWLQTQMDYTQTWAGLAAAPVGILTIFISPLVGNYMHKFDLRLMISVGFIIFAGVSFWNASFNVGVSYIQLIEPRLVQGIGMALFFVPLISVIISGLPPTRVASALGLSNFCRILGGSFGTSLSVTMWDRREAFHHSRLVENVTNFNLTTTSVIEQLHTLALPEVKGFTQLNRVITNQAYMLSTNDLFWLSGWMFLILLVIIWLTKPPFLSTKTTAVAAE